MKMIKIKSPFFLFNYILVSRILPIRDKSFQEEKKKEEAQNCTLDFSSKCKPNNGKATSSGRKDISKHFAISRFVFDVRHKPPSIKPPPPHSPREFPTIRNTLFGLSTVHPPFPPCNRKLLNTYTRDLHVWFIQVLDSFRLLRMECLSKASREGGNSIERRRYKIVYKTVGLVGNRSFPKERYLFFFFLFLFSSCLIDLIFKWTLRFSWKFGFFFFFLSFALVRTSNPLIGVRVTFRKSLIFQVNNGGVFSYRSGYSSNCCFTISNSWRMQG